MSHYFANMSKLASATNIFLNYYVEKTPKYMVRRDLGNVLRKEYPDSIDHPEVQSLFAHLKALPDEGVSYTEFVTTVADFNVRINKTSKESNIASATDILLGYYYKKAPKNMVRSDLGEMLRKEYPDAIDHPEVQSLFAHLKALPNEGVSYTEFVTTVADFNVRINKTSKESNIASATDILLGYYYKKAPKNMVRSDLDEMLRKEYPDAIDHPEVQSLFAHLKALPDEGVSYTEFVTTVADFNVRINKTSKESNIASATDILLGYYYKKAPKNMVRSDLGEMLRKEYPDAIDHPEVQSLFAHLKALPNEGVSYTEFVTTVADFNVRINKTSKESNIASATDILLGYYYKKAPKNMVRSDLDEMLRKEYPDAIDHPEVQSLFAHLKALPDEGVSYTEFVTTVADFNVRINKTSKESNIASATDILLGYYYKKAPKNMVRSDLDEMLRKEYPDAIDHPEVQSLFAHLKALPNEGVSYTEFVTTVADFNVRINKTSKESNIASATDILLGYYYKKAPKNMVRSDLDEMLRKEYPDAIDHPEVQSLFAHLKALPDEGVSYTEFVTTVADFNVRINKTSKESNIASATDILLGYYYKKAPKNMVRSDLDEMLRKEYPDAIDHPEVQSLFAHLKALPDEGVSYTEFVTTVADFNMRINKTPKESNIASATDILLGYYYKKAPKNMVRSDLDEMLRKEYPDAIDHPEVQSLFAHLKALPDEGVSYTEFVTTVADFNVRINKTSKESNLASATDIFLGYYYRKAPKNMVRSDLDEMLRKEYPDAIDHPEVQSLFANLKALPDEDVSYTEFVTTVADFDMRINKTPKESNLASATDIFLGYYYRKAPKNMVRSDLDEMLRKEFPDAIDHPEVQSLFAHLKALPDEDVSYTEFVTTVADFDMRINKTSNMSRLETAMKLLKEVFDEYAKVDGEAETMTKSELADLLRKEFASGAWVSKTVLLKKLDGNADGVVDFKEFVDILTNNTLFKNKE